MRKISWKRRKLWVTFVVLAISVIVLICVVTRSSRDVDYKVFVKPSYTNLDELKERKMKGYLENTPLKDLLKYTKCLHRPNSLCKDNTEIVILVQSACDNGEQRNSIRKTWGKQAMLMNTPVWFFLGQCPNSEKERLEHNDIVELDFVDSYHNNTLKSLSRYRLFKEECSHSKYLIMSDDDVIVNIETLFNLLNGGIGYSIIGPYYLSGSYVIRDRQSQWYVPTWVWPADHYPEYIGGGFYVINGSAAETLYEASLNINFMTIDDVLFTGIAGDMIGIHRINDQRFPYRRNSNLLLCSAASYLASSDWNAEEIQQYWNTRKQCKEAQ